jgi:hypothetical protein
VVGPSLKGVGGEGTPFPHFMERKFEMIKPNEKEESPVWLLIVYGGFISTGVLIYLGKTGRISMGLAVILAAIIYVPWILYLLVTFWKNKKPKSFNG